jgi:hypothetical protein
MPRLTPAMIASVTDTVVSPDFMPRSGSLANAKLFIEAGFEAWDGGGGCQYWRYETDDGYVMVTPEDGIGGLPEDGEKMLAGHYPDDYGLGDEGVTDEDEAAVVEVGVFDTAAALFDAVAARGWMPGAGECTMCQARVVHGQEYDGVVIPHDCVFCSRKCAEWWLRDQMIPIDEAIPPS